MFKHRLAYSALALLAIGCAGADGSEPLDEGGQISLPLTATTATGVVYRLNKATFVIKDLSCNKVVATVKPTPDQAVHNVSLKAGTYSITLSAGWVLQRKVGTAWQDTTGKLTGQPTGSFKIKARATTVLNYSFGFDNNPQPPSTSLSTLSGGSGCNGTARITITVTDEAPPIDCNNYSSKISALAAFTIDCLQTLNATQYVVLADGTLGRNFTTCSTPDPQPEADGSDSRIASIDGILSLQYARPDLGYPELASAVANNQAYSKQCIAVAWGQWSQGTQPNVCPTWTKISTVNAVDDEDQIGSIADALADPTVDPETQSLVVIPTDPDIVASEKELYYYQVELPDGAEPNCGTVDQCARLCAGGFLGFVTGSDGNVVISDPAYWELGNKYPPGGDPFLSGGYYHAMADYGPVPGDQFGHAERAKSQNGNGVVQGEPCTYYSGGKRFFTQLILSTNSTGSVSWCKPPGGTIN